MPEKETEIDFEKALAELEKLVETMEKGDLTLEESLKQFERGRNPDPRLPESPGGSRTESTNY